MKNFINLSSCLLLQGLALLLLQNGLATGNSHHSNTLRTITHQQHTPRLSLISSQEEKNTFLQEKVTVFRGGAPKKKDSNTSTYPLVKIAIAGVVEALIMHQSLLLAITGNSYEGNIATVFQVLLVLSVPFGSSTYGSLIDNGLTAATKQIMSPNEIPGDANWYAKLQKPSWSPPGWIFPIMWLLISKPTQFVAVWNLVKSTGTDAVTPELNLAFLVYCTHLALGDAWNKVFFGLQQTGSGVVIISTFWTVLLTSAYLFYQLDPSAGLFLVPTCLWVSVASALNWSIYLLNKNTSRQK
jgi:benzodiazapine receptor